MSSHRLQVLAAVKALVAAALPACEVIGLDNDELAPTRPGPAGRVVIRAGEPGEPEMTLGVLTYSYDHRIPIELAVPAGDAGPREAVLDALAAAIGAAVEADRHLGGLTEWTEPEALVTDDIYVPGAAAVREGNMALIASYTTANPVT